MKNYFPFHTIVGYRDKEVADKWVEEFCNEYPDAIKYIRKSKDFTHIVLQEDSVIDVIPAIENMRGKRADRVYLDKNVHEFIKDNVFYPMRASAFLIEI